MIDSTSEKDDGGGDVLSNPHSKASFTALSNTSRSKSFMQTLVGRGYLYQCTDEAGLDKLAQTEKLVGYIEFNYPLLQSYDFVELYKRHGCRLQLGGSDQWGNITTGVDLTRRMEGGECYGFTTPLITTASGGKMGKTADGAVWLNGDPSLGDNFTRSPYEYWQFWRNTEDADVGKFLRLFTDMPESDVAKMEALEGAEINAAKTALANAATELLHGKDAADKAAAAAQQTFSGAGTSKDLPSVDVPAAEIEGMGILNAAVVKISVGKKKHALLKVL